VLDRSKKRRLQKQPLFRVPVPWFSGADATSDGGRFLIAAPVEQAAPPAFTVVLNWQAELKR